MSRKQEVQPPAMLNTLDEPTGSVRFEGTDKCPKCLGQANFIVFDYETKQAEAVTCTNCQGIGWITITRNWIN